MAGVNCSQPNVRVNGLPLEPNFWRVASWSQDVRPCKQFGVCLGGSNVTTQCKLGHNVTSAYCAMCVAQDNSPCLILPAMPVKARPSYRAVNVRVRVRVCVLQLRRRLLQGRRGRV